MRMNNNPILIAKCKKCLRLIFSNEQYIYEIEKTGKIYYHYSCQPNYTDPYIIKKQTKIEEAKLNKEVKKELEKEEEAEDEQQMS